jgi:transcriptional regulator with XRE-family HTH domain
MGNFVPYERHAREVAHRVELPPGWDDYARELGRNFARARTASGLSQERVAAIAGVSANTYQKYERGHSRPGAPLNLTLVNLVAVAQALGVTVAELLPPSPPDATVGS